MTGMYQNENMDSIFFGCRNFNQSLNDWNMSNVTDTSAMFYQCHSFNKWDGSKVECMDSMFFESSSFNQELNDWNVSNVKVWNVCFRNLSISINH